MPNDWIIDVLADLKTYAEMNGMAATAASLEDTTLIALAEGVSAPAEAETGEGQMAQAGHDGDAGKVTWLFAGRGFA